MITHDQIRAHADDAVARFGSPAAAYRALTKAADRSMDLGCEVIWLRNELRKRAGVSPRRDIENCRSLEGRR